MCDTDEWPMPNYEAPPRKHMHALGIISLNYNSFEYVLYAIFRSPLASNNVPEKFIQHIFSEFNRQQQVEALRTAFQSYEKDPDVLDRITHLLAHFHWCYETRDILMHAHRDHTADGAPDKLSLAKRSKGDFSKFNFMYLSLPHLRAIADHMYEGYVFALNLFIYFENRNGGVPRIFSDVFSSALPSKPQIPKKIKLRDGPVTHEDEYGS